MADLRFRTGAGNEITVADGAVARLGASLRGSLLSPGMPAYDEARTIWNAMIERRPSLIARCASAADVQQVVRFAREHGLLLAIKGGGHNIAGNAVCDGGLMIDLSPMKSVRVDPVRQTAVVEPGCTLRDFDHDAQTFGLATPLGINSTTGVAGLTLGGGFGWLSRRFGMTIDNLRAADIVTADGKLVSASARENEDLFWAIRGGGGNFGVVTAFEFQMHRVGPQVLAGLIIHPYGDAENVLRHYADFAAQASTDLACWLVLRQAPPLPFLAPDVHGKEVVIIAVCHSGDMPAGERELEPLRRFGRPLADVVGPHPYVAWQQAFDPLLAPGARNYWKSHNLANPLSDGLLHKLAGFGRRLPSAQCEVFLGQIGGATSRVPSDAMAYAHRDADYAMNVHARWDSASQDAECIGWARAIIDETAPFATGGVYVNFMTQDEAGRVPAAYGSNHARLLALKAKYDPTNLFRMNQNLQPAATV